MNARQSVLMWSLNPCCSGNRSRSIIGIAAVTLLGVLILVVVEIGLGGLFFFTV